ncbi:MAG: alpha/beta hydrolase-fold protein [Planctomycetota bacterium]|nr:alpha/beta hydrolase-fold protein [Planctomycetota bacterium]
MPQIVRAFIVACLASQTLGGFSSCELSAADRWEFPVRFSKTIRAEPYSGRVYLIFTKRDREPRLGPGWFSPEQFVSAEVTNWQPDSPLMIASGAAASPGVAASLRSYPDAFSTLNLSEYRVQAVARFNAWHREIGTGTGNGFSATAIVAAEGIQPELVINAVVPEREFLETASTKLLKIKSHLLSEFYGRDVYQQASVTLPASYESSPSRRYPTIFEIPGFSGDHYYRTDQKPPFESRQDGVEFIRVMLDPSCPLGHHVFADSANNGPRGKCLVDEFLPEFDQKFRSIAKPTARFLTGHSSGGWSSLWIQVSYPDHFGGVWSTAPDPVDFRDFQKINLYAPDENMYSNAEGKPRPLARIGGQVRLWYKGFADMEWALGPGGQLHSFEAVFSDRRDDGKPQLVWDRETGKVFTDVARTWEKYDIRLVLERNWEQLGPKLQGKLHVFMGDQDTFYLEGATVLLKQSLAKLGSDARVDIMPGRDHFNLLPPELRDHIRSEMVASFQKNHPDGN